jgi:hypothetical protein
MLEVLLVLLSAAITCLLFVMPGYKVVVLNLFFLPVALGAFFLGRYRAGVLALFCGIAASLVVTQDVASFCSTTSPLVIGLAVTAWMAMLGLMALVIGTLSDELNAKVGELHDAYVGVVEVLSKYLQSAHPRLKAWSVQVAELSAGVAQAMKLSLQDVDDIRVAALLYDIGNIEVTTKVIRRAVGMFHDDSSPTHQATFQGTDLMLSLGSVLNGAVPLLLDQDHAAPENGGPGSGGAPADVPLGSKIIRLVRDYATLAAAGHAGSASAPREILRRLAGDRAARYDPEILSALDAVLSQPRRSPRLPIDADAAEPLEAYTWVR